MKNLLRYTLLCCLCTSYMSVAGAKVKQQDNWLDFTLFDNKLVNLMNKHAPKGTPPLQYSPQQFSNVNFIVDSFYITSGQPTTLQDGQTLEGNRAGENKNKNSDQMSILVQAGRKGSNSVNYSIFGNPMGSLLESYNTTFNNLPLLTSGEPVESSESIAYTPPTTNALNFGLIGTLNFQVNDEGTNQDQIGNYTCKNIMLAQGNNAVGDNHIWWFGGKDSQWVGQPSHLLHGVVSLCSRNNQFNYIPVIFLRGNSLVSLDTNDNQVKVYPSYNELCANKQKSTVLIPVIEQILDAELSTQLTQLQQLLTKAHNIDASNIIPSKMCTNSLAHNQITKEIAKIIAQKFNLNSAQEAEIAEVLNQNLCKDWDPDKISQEIAEVVAQTIATSYCGTN